MENKLLTSFSEAATPALLNKLIQSQHQILVSELTKIEKLNDLIGKKKDM